MEAHLITLRRQREIINHIRYEDGQCLEGQCFCYYEIRNLDNKHAPGYIFGHIMEESGQLYFKFRCLERQCGGYPSYMFTEFRLYSPNIDIERCGYAEDIWYQHRDRLHRVELHFVENCAFYGEGPYDDDDDEEEEENRQQILQTLMEGLEGMNGVPEGMYLQCCDFLKTLYNKQ